jgi:hypothetical protein
VHVIRLELVRDLDVQITVVLFAWSCVEHAGNGLAFLDSQDVLKVEDGLFPVSVFCVGASGELDWLVAGSKLNVEPGNDGVHKVAAADLQAVRAVECQIGHCAGVEVESKDGRGVGDNGFDVNGIDEGLSHGGRLQGSVIETPNVVPD